MQSQTRESAKTILTGSLIATIMPVLGSAVLRTHSKADVSCLHSLVGQAKLLGQYSLGWQAAASLQTNDHSQVAAGE